MEAQVWTLIALLTATLVSSFFYVNNKMDGRFDRFEARFDGLESNLGARIDGVESKLAGRIDRLEAKVDSRFDALTGDIRAHATRIDALSGRVEEQGRTLSSQMYDLAARLEDHLRWHAG